MLKEQKLSFKKIHSRRLFEEVCDQIRNQIAAGNLRPGDKLPAERQLAEQFGISRSAVREALRSLEYAGLIVQRKGVKGGSFILGTEMGLVQSFQNIFEAGGLSLVELTEARIAIQEIVVRMVVKNATEADFKALEKDLRKTERDLSEGIANIDPSSTQGFYSILAEVTGNRVIVMIVKALSQMLYQAILLLNPPFDFDIVNVRQQFITKLRARDADGAVEVMTEYLLFLHNHIIAMTNKQGEGRSEAELRSLKNVT